MSETNYAEWLKAQFTINKDKAKADLARALGLEPPAISKILNGTRQIKAREYTIMRQFFGLPVDGINRANTVMPVKTIGNTQTLMNDNDQDFDWQMPDEFLKMGRKVSPVDVSLGQFGNFCIQDHYMEPHFKSGETILVDLSDKIPSPSGVFVVSDKFSHMVRHCEIIPQSQSSEIKITAYDKGFQTQILRISDFEIVGRVVARVAWISDNN